MGRRLSGAAIVGVGLPGLCMERDLIRDQRHVVGGCDEWPVATTQHLFEIALPRFVGSRPPQ